MTSGVPMLFGVDSTKPVAYRLHDSSSPLLLTNGQRHVLYQCSNQFAVGTLHYTLEFANFTQDLYDRFVQRRNLLLNSFGFPAPHAGLSAIFRHQDTKRGPVITHGTLSTGKFGVVCAGVIALTGEPVAVKQHRADNLHQLRLIRREAEVGMQFKLYQGLLPIELLWCEHRSISVCNQLPQALFTASPLALCDWSDVTWDNFSLSSVKDCFRGPLQGLAALHAAGYMHRDVHMRNVFLVRSAPPEAVLGDFGKTIQAESASDNCLGPIHTRAPEVDGQTQYTNKIDVWSLGNLLLRIVSPSKQLRGGESPSVEWHQTVMQYLEEIRRDRAGTFDADMAHLIQCMLTWIPKDRPTASQILEHPCFAGNYSCFSETNARPPVIPPPIPMRTGISTTF